MNFTGYYTNAEQYTRNVGFSTNNQTFKYLFSDDTLDFISSEVTKLLRGIVPGGRDIVVPHETIVSVLNNIYISYRPQTGDIYSRYNITQFEPRDDANHIITETIQVIVSQIKSEYGMMENNYKLDIWDSVLLGDGISR